MIDFDPDRGRIEVRGIRYLLIQPRTLVGFQKATGPIEARMEAGGREGGRNSSRRLREKSDLRGKEFAQAYLDMGARIGWGVFSVTRFEEGRFEVEVRGSPFAEEFSGAGAPVCHFTRGVIAGLGDTLFGSASCEEVECAADRCRFVCHA